MTTNERIIGPLSWKTGTFSGMKYGAVTIREGVLGIQKLSGLTYALVIGAIGIVVGLGIFQGAIPAAVFGGGGVWIGRKWGMRNAMNDLEGRTPEELLENPDVKIEATEVYNTSFKKTSLANFPKSVLRVETESDEYLFYADREALEDIRNALRTKDLTSETMYCTDCGTELSVEREDCPECGAVVAP